MCHGRGKNNHMNEDENIEEECSVCGKVLKVGQGRFRMADLVLCIDCYYIRHQRDTANDKNNGHIKIDMD